MSEDHMIHMSLEDHKTLMRECAKDGAREVLKDLGLDGPEAREDIHDLRGLLRTVREAHKTFIQTIVRMSTIGIVGLILFGLVAKLKTFGH